MLSVGIEKEITLTVSQCDTAKALGSGLIEVFSTPRLIALMEEASHTAVGPFLEDGMTTVGISISMNHTSATPVGMKVTVRSVLREIDRKRLVFEVSAFDERGEIGSGVHERFIVNAEAFLERTNNK